MKLSLIHYFLLSCIFFICGCFLLAGQIMYDEYTAPGKLFYPVKKEVFFSDLANLEKYRVIFQSDLLSPKEGLLSISTFQYSVKKYRMPKENRIDIFVSNLDGTSKVNLTSSLHKDELTYFLFPSLSPDGSKLAFVGYTNIKIREIDMTWREINYTLEGYLVDKGDFTLKRIVSIPKHYSISDGKLYAGTINNQFEFIEPLWSKDGKRLLVDKKIVSVEEPNSVVSLDSDKFFNDEEYKRIKDDFVERWSRFRSLYPFISPDGRYEIENSYDTKGFGPPIPKYELGMIHPGKWTLEPMQVVGIPRVYLKTPSGNIKICNGHFDRVQWSSDSKYAIGFNKLQNKFYIINLKGECVSFKGSFPRIQ